MNTFSIITFGCKVNYAESSKISNELIKNDFLLVNIKNKPDFVIINSCSVTNSADVECVKTIKSIIKENVNVKIIITGCATRNNDIRNIKNIIAIFNNNEKNKIVDYILNKNKEEGNNNDFYHAYSLNARTRSFLKIQDGCNYWCSYCVIPQTRGISRSDSIESIISDVIKIRDNGYKEIVLTGINIGDYGLINNKRKYTFYELLLAIDKIEHVPRVRISSIEPNLLTSNIINLVKTSKTFVEHFHIPLQSGNDEILKAMRRRYDTNLYKNKILEVKNLMPYCCIGVDVIVGFPGETEEKFFDTYNFLKNLPISYLHVFPFSERENTLAIKLKDKIPTNIKKQRVNILRQLSNEKKYIFYKENIGNTVEVLFESKNKNGKIYGYSGNYIRISIDYNKNIENKLINTKIRNIDENNNIIVDVL
jgi:threonylcarbamoyladenosine tRNA methylthiotransferase MtaB